MTDNKRRALIVVVSAIVVLYLAPSSAAASARFLPGAPNYDFIIVGSGSAGSVIANRLSENPSWSVLLLEAGRNADFFTRIPILASALQLTNYNWGYKMERQNGIGYGMKNQQLSWPRGKALGGSTVINYMIYSRGHPQDYDKWAASRSPGWSYAEVFPYFLKSEKAYNLSNSDANFHGSHGLLSVQNSYQSQLVGAFLEAGQQLGYPVVDYAASNIIGFAPVQTTTTLGKRHSVASAFLDPIQNRSNLVICTSCNVTKILINPRTMKAYGVRYTKHDQLQTVLATKEVILSAGALNSPQILMLSGIGPKHHLQNIGIDVIKDLPVGQNLHDHLTYIGLNFLINETLSLTLQKILNVRSVTEFMFRGSGPLTSIGGVEGIAFINTADPSNKTALPNIELLLIGGSLSTDYGLTVKPSVNIADNVYNKFWGPLHGRHVWSIFPMLLHPKSVGFIHLRSKDPNDPPKFYGNYYTDPRNEDIKTMISAIRFILKLVKTPAFQRFESRLSDILVPGCENLMSDSDEYWECALRTFTINIHHQAGTCKMGPESDLSSVVDPELRVHGIRGLRVADASVIPFPLTGHNNAPTIMVGEKAADLIKEAWK